MNFFVLNLLIYTSEKVLNKEKKLWRNTQALLSASEYEQVNDINF